MGRFFNEVNLDPSRVRHRINGRVLCTTTSRFVEFVENSLRFSYPLWAQDDGSPGLTCTFMVELQGHLVFEAGAQVKICEVGPFTRADYDPLKFKQIYVSDPYVPVVTRIRPQYPNDQGLSYTLDLYYSQQNGNEGYATVQTKPPMLTTAEQWEAYFPIGSPWLGLARMPGFQSPQS